MALGTIINSLADFSKEDQELIKKAEEALDHAYAPYSKFHVGSAVRLSNGEICQGSNQENAAYPMCMCGERVAMYHAIARFPKETFTTLAIICKNQQKPIDSIGAPCGACRQVICEYEMRFGKDIKIILIKDDLSSFIVLDRAKDLVPYSFDGSML